MKIAIGDESYPPYSLRPLYPKFLGFLAYQAALLIDHDNPKATQLNLLTPVMSIFNFLLLAISTVLLFLVLKKILEDELLCGLLALGLIVNPGTIQTAPFFMLDIVSYCCAAFAIYFFAFRKYFWLCLTIVIGLFLKEVLIIYSVLFIYPILLDRSQWFKYAKLFAVPLLFFVGFRVLMKTDPLSMQYEWDISKGDVRLDYLIGHIGDGNR